MSDLYQEDKQLKFVISEDGDNVVVACDDREEFFTKEEFVSAYGEESLPARSEVEGQEKIPSSLYPARPASPEPQPAKEVAKPEEKSDPEPQFYWQRGQYE